MTTELEPSSNAPPVSAVAAAAAQSSSSQQRSNPRRQLRRYLTADSAVLQQLHQLTDNKKKQATTKVEEPDQEQSIHLWTSGLMAEFNHVIDGEIQRLNGSSPASSDSSSHRREEPEGAEEDLADGVRSLRGQRRLSPWARTQMAIIDPLDPVKDHQPTDRTSIEQLSADIDSVQRQILHDLDDLTATLERQEKLARANKPAPAAVAKEDDDDHLTGPILVSLIHFNAGWMLEEEEFVK